MLEGIYADHIIIIDNLYKNDKIIYDRRVFIMNKKWAVVFEYDLRQGLCVLARKNAGEGEVALFNSKKEAEDWVGSSGEIDPDLFEINYISFTV